MVARYEGANPWRSVLQLVTTLGPLCGIFYLMYRSLSLSPWVTLLLSIPAAGFLVRTFVLMHDCSHGSFFRKRWMNETVGFITGVITLTPFARWRRDHSMHHASAGDLDRRGHGDVPTLTVREYQSRTPAGRLRYRLFRHPLVIVFLGPIQVVLAQRLHRKSAPLSTDEGRSVVITNVAALVVAAAFSFWIGVPAVAIIYLPSMYIAAAMGVWLFYVQHQFEDTYWTEHSDWDFATAAIRGSSHFKLPPLLRWMTGNIGLHHVHHLSPRIPNYRLQRAHDENTLFHGATTLTFVQSIGTLRLSLWDEKRGRLVSFADADRYERAVSA
jgi:omega-6 fatty acid desaturase (delta-12 desaturase)